VQPAARGHLVRQKPCPSTPRSRSLPSLFDHPTRFDPKPTVASDRYGARHNIILARPCAQNDYFVQSINLAIKLSTFSEYWQPRVVGQFNGNDLMVVKVKAEFVWHQHDDTDAFFFVLKDGIDIQLRNGVVTLGPGEVFVVPKCVEHRPVAAEEAHVLLPEQFRISLSDRLGRSLFDGSGWLI
jgi:mannose-6-phosphate isomerase-like protein (cupin superfamily)